MKLLILTDGIFPFVIGGMQKHSHYLAKHLAKQGHQITLVHCVAHHQAMPSYQEVLQSLDASAADNIEVLSFRFPQPSWYPGHYLNESYLYSQNVFDKLNTRLNEFDFIYAKGFAAWYFLKKKKSGKKMPPIGVKFHGYEMFQHPADLKSRLKNWLLRGPVEWNNRNADVVFSYGGKITDIILGLKVNASKIIEIPTGIESSWCRHELPIKKNDKLNFVFVGRYERRKGIEELNLALRSLVAQNDFQFHFIGPIPPQHKIKSNKIIYHGVLSTIDEIQRVIDTCEVLVTPSHSEGMPNVITEGMARGLAILATDVGAIASLVDEANGWFVAPGNAAELGEVMVSIIDDSTNSLTQKRNASLQRIKNFQWENIARITADEIGKRL